jgi:hypothetical protein
MTIDLHDVGNRLYGKKRGDCLRGFGKQFQYRSGNDTESALRSQKQLFKIIAGVVLAKTLESVPDLTVRQNYLDAKDQVPHHSVAKNVKSASVCRNVAPDLATALCTERKWE